MDELKFILDLNLYAKTKKASPANAVLSLNRCLAMTCKDALMPRAQDVQERCPTLLSRSPSNSVRRNKAKASWGQNGRKAILHSVSCPNGELHG